MCEREAAQLPDTVAEPGSTADFDALSDMGDEIAGDLDAVAQKAGK